MNLYMSIALNKNQAKDELINNNWFALLVAMLLDQQISILWAFNGPNRILEKINKHRAENKLTPLPKNSILPSFVIEFEEQEFVDLICSKPTIHRYPKVMASRIYELAAYIFDEFNGKVEQIWESETDANSVYKSLLDLPGFWIQV